MSTAVAQCAGLSSSARGLTDGLRWHLESNLRDLWDLWPAPVWIANPRGEIVYANRTARSQHNGPGLRHAAARIAETADGEAAPPTTAGSGRTPIEVSSLLDGCGERIGWLAFGIPA